MCRHHSHFHKLIFSLQEVDEFEKLKETSDPANERPQAEGSSKIQEAEPALTQATPCSPMESTPASFPASENQPEKSETQTNAGKSTVGENASTVLDDRPETIGESSPLQIRSDMSVQENTGSGSGVIEERTPGDGEGGETNQEMVIGILNAIVDSVVQGILIFIMVHLKSVFI